nr:VanW family protein [Fredinandcohnia sp. SECRCQ15]
MSKWVKEIGEINIDPLQVFSLETFVTESGVTFTDDALSVVATGIYETILPTNFKIIERHTSDRLPEYAKFGFDAKVVQGNKDIIIYNVNSYKYKLLFSLVDEGLEIELIGAELPNEYEITVEDSQLYSPKTIIQYSSLLQLGKEEIKEAGEKGQIGTVYRSIRDNNYEIEKIKISQDYYAPIPRVKVSSILIPDPNIEESNQESSHDSNVEVPDSTHINEDNSEDDSLWGGTVDEK